MTNSQIKLLLLDLDGTLREPKSGNDFIQHPLDQKIIPGADIAIAHYAAKGYFCVGITNQGGVEAGFKSFDDCAIEQQQTLQFFPGLQEILFCPDFGGRDCWRVVRDSEIIEAVHYTFWGSKFSGKFRKPQPGMLLAAIEQFQNVESSQTWFIGDRPEDELATEAAGINFLAAQTWRDRFLPGIHEIRNINRKQIEFLEAV